MSNTNKMSAEQSKNSLTPKTLWILQVCTHTINFNDDFFQEFSRVLFCEREDSFDDVYFEKGQKEIVRWFFS